MTNRSGTLTRRSFLTTTTTGVATLAAPSIARAQPTDLIIGVNGGSDYEAMYKAVYRPFEQKYNVRIVPVFGDYATLLNRVFAERNRPTLDMVLTFQGTWDVGKREGLFEKVNYANIPHVNEIYPFLHDKDGYAPFCILTAWGLVYNEFAGKGVAPTSLKDLWLPRFANQVMLGGIYHYSIHLPAFAYAWTGNQADIDTAFKKITELMPSVSAFYGLSSDAQSKFQEGVGSVAPWFANAAQRVRNLGVPLRFRAPEEGAFLYVGGLQAVKGTKKLDLVEKLIGQFYDPEGAVDQAKLNGYIPCNQSVKLDADLSAQLLTEEQIKISQLWDWDLINSNQEAWLKRWNAEIRPLLRS